MGAGTPTLAWSGNECALMPLIGPPDAHDNQLTPGSPAPSSPSFSTPIGVALAKEKTPMPLMKTRLTLYRGEMRLGIQKMKASDKGSTLWLSARPEVAPYRWVSHKPTRTEINYAVARVRFHSSKRRTASIAC